MPELDRRLFYTPENVLGIWLIQEFHRLRTVQYLSRRAAFVLQDVFFYHYDRIIIWIIFYFCYSCYCVGQTIFCCFHLHDCSFQMCLDWERTAPALNRPLAETQRHPNRIYSHDQLVQGVKSSVWLWNLFEQRQYNTPETRSLRLKLIPIGLSFWFSRFCNVIPTMSLSLRFCHAWRNRSFKLARKWLTESVASEGGTRRTTSCVPLALKRLYCRVILSSISNLRAMVIVCKLWKYVCKLRGICAVSHWKLSSQILLL